MGDPKPRSTPQEEQGLLPRKIPDNMIRFHTIEKDKDGYNRFCKFCLHSKVRLHSNSAGPESSL